MWAGTTTALPSTSCTILLKSAPPVWAGTEIRAVSLQALQLKSAPPVWAGTGLRTDHVFESELKSAPPVWAGTHRAGSIGSGSCHLNPPRPCGRGHCLEDVTAVKPLLKSAPPVWAGTLHRRPLNRRTRSLKSAPPVWAGTKARNRDTAIDGT